MNKQLLIALSAALALNLPAFADTGTSSGLEKSRAPEIADPEDRTGIRDSADGVRQAPSRDDDGMRARMGTGTSNKELTSEVRDAANVYRAIVKGSQGEIPKSTRMNAKCIAVFPNLISAGLVVGGMHGTGVASCKTTDGSWSPVSPVSLSGGSIGLQAGAKSSDLVLFLMDEPAVTALKQGRFVVGGEVSAVAGNYDASAQTEPKGVIAYSRTEGAYAGATLNGVNLSRSTEELRRFYGPNADFAAILDGRTTPEHAALSKPFTDLLPS